MIQKDGYRHICRFGELIVTSPIDPPTYEERPAAVGLVRVIGPCALGANIISMIIGAGIFVVPAALASGVGPYAPIASFACGIAVGAVAICFAEGGSRIPTSGGSECSFTLTRGDRPCNYNRRCRRYDRARQRRRSATRRAVRRRHNSAQTLCHRLFLLPSGLAPFTEPNFPSTGDSTLGTTDGSHLPAASASTEEPIAAIRLEPRYPYSRGHLEPVQDLS
jgi:hypothetical protein